MKRLLMAFAISAGLISPSMAHHHGHRHAGHYGPTASPELVTQVAVENGISPALAHAVVRKESGYRCGVRNGIMQTSPATARSMGVSGSLTDCRNGLTAGMRYLKQSIAMHGYGCAAFSAYQSGLGVHRCSGYGRSIQAMMGRGEPRTERYEARYAAPVVAAVAPVQSPLDALFGSPIPAQVAYAEPIRHHRHYASHSHYARYASHHHHYRHYASR